jgi:hypothetical protein
VTTTTVLKTLLGTYPHTRAIEMAAQFAYEQQIVPKVYAVEELFRPDVIRLG